MKTFKQWWRYSRLQCAAREMAFDIKALLQTAAARRHWEGPVEVKVGKTGDAGANMAPAVVMVGGVPVGVITVYVGPQPDLLAGAEGDRG